MNGQRGRGRRSKGKRKSLDGAQSRGQKQPQNADKEEQSGKQQEYDSKESSGHKLEKTGKAKNQASPLKSKLPRPAVKSGSKPQAREVGRLEQTGAVMPDLAEEQPKITSNKDQNGEPPDLLEHVIHSQHEKDTVLVSQMPECESVPKELVQEKNETLRDLVSEIILKSAPVMQGGEDGRCLSTDQEWQDPAIVECGLQVGSVTESQNKEESAGNRTEKEVQITSIEYRESLTNVKEKNIENSDAINATQNGHAASNCETLTLKSNDECASGEVSGELGENGFNINEVETNDQQTNGRKSPSVDSDNDEYQLAPENIDRPNVGAREVVANNVPQPENDNQSSGYDSSVEASPVKKKVTKDRNAALTGIASLGKKKDEAAANKSEEGTNITKTKSGDFASPVSTVKMKLPHTPAVLIDSPAPSPPGTPFVVLQPPVFQVPTANPDHAVHDGQEAAESNDGATSSSKTEEIAAIALGADGTEERDSLMQNKGEMEHEKGNSDITLPSEREKEESSNLQEQDKVAEETDSKKKQLQEDESHENKSKELPQPKQPELTSSQTLLKSSHSRERLDESLLTRKSIEDQGPAGMFWCCTIL